MAKNGMSAYLGSTGNTKNFWMDTKPVFKVVDSNKLQISGSRYLDQPGVERDWEYGQTRLMIVGFMDQWFGVKGGREIPLTLNSGYQTEE